jgi:hypothetical protein
VNCRRAGARVRWAAGELGLSARNFGYSSVDLRICAPEALCTTRACDYR